jgi:para-nitrobenzyl esterase
MSAILALKTQQHAATCTYYFDYNTTLAEGRLKSFHTAELPLATGLVYVPETKQLSRWLSGAWAAFARTGSPNRPGLPEWRRFVNTGPEARRGATMHYDVSASVCVDNFRTREISALQHLV